MSRLLACVSLVAILLSATAVPAQTQVRFHGYLQWSAGSKMVLVTDGGASVTVDLTEVDQTSYQALMGGDGITVVAVVRRLTRRDDDVIPLLAVSIEPDRR